jgi:hypothetical protein
MVTRDKLTILKAKDGVVPAGESKAKYLAIFEEVRRGASHRPGPTARM